MATLNDAPLLKALIHAVDGSLEYALAEIEKLSAAGVEVLDAGTTVALKIAYQRVRTELGDDRWVR
jgi:hypothetical protein